jgi:hypothetical protein
MDSTYKEASTQIAESLSATEPKTLEEVMSWQKELRESVDRAIIARFTPIFNSEFNRRRGESEVSNSQICSWANNILHSAKLTVLTPDGLPALLVAQKSHPEDTGRMYMISYASNEASKHRKYTSLANVPAIELCSMPTKTSSLSKSR